MVFGFCLSASELLLSFSCNAPFIVQFNIEEMRRPDLMGKLVEGSYSCAPVILLTLPKYLLPLSL